MPPKKPQKAQQPESSMTEEEEVPAESASLEEEIQPIDVSKIIKGTMVMCKHTDGMYYEAKVMDVTADKEGVRQFLVHYSGWNKRYDEKIGEDKAQERFSEHKTELAEHFKKVHKEKVGKPVRKSTVGTPSEKADRESSRGSTPAARSTPRAASSLSTTDAGTPVSKQPRRGTAAEPQPIRDPVRKDVTPTVMFTESLRAILTDDQNYITGQKKLAKLPARHTVQNIINDYIKSIGEMDEHSNVLVEYSGGMSLANTTKSTLKESAVGLLDYFDATIGSLLLYKFERPQYSALFEAEKEKLPAELRDKVDNDKALPKSRTIRMSSHYGFVHLLRMFVRLGEILSYTPWAPRSMETIMKHAQDLVLFLSKKAPEYYDEKQDYVDATPEYEKSVWAPHV